MGSKVQIKSVINSSPAHDDAFSALEDLISYLDVLDNDGGGSAAQLYALMDNGLSAEAIALALQNPVSTDYETSLGAIATIVTTGENAGTISYDASALDYLAEGEEVTDTFSYVIRLANGTYSIATVTVTVTGTNDRPYVGAVMVDTDAGVMEDGPVYHGSFAGDDIDSDDDATSLTYLILSQPDEGSVTIDPNNSAGFVFDPGSDFQDLDAGETRTVTFTYQAMDRHGALSEPATVTIVVSGQSNDTTDGIVSDGYIANALVFRDSNDNGVWDHEAFVDSNGNWVYDVGEAFTDADNDGAFDAEFFTLTDANGEFSGLEGTGRIVVQGVPGGFGLPTFPGSIDISTGHPWLGTYSAPAGSTVVTPLTTLIDAIAGAGATAEDIAAAEALVAAALGIDPSVDLGSYDPLAIVAGTTDPDTLALAVEVQKAAAQIANILYTIEETVAAVGVPDPSSQVITALAAQIVAAEGGTVDLGSSDLIASVMVDAAAAGSSEAQTAIASQSTGIAESLASINTAIAEVTITDDPIGALAQVVAAQIVAQGYLASDAVSSVQSGTPVDSSSYSGSNLTDQLDQAAGSVEIIIPQDNTTSLLAPDRPSVDDGARINAAEIADGVVVTVTFDAASGVVAGDSLKLLLGGVEVDSYVLQAGDVGAGGSLVHAFVVSAATLGPDGAKVLTAQFTTSGGTTGPASLPALITVDTIAAAPVIVGLVSDTGSSNSDHVTNSAALSLTGVEAGATVQYSFDNGANWSADYTPAQGANTVVVRQVDAAGNVSDASAPFSFTYDTVAPGPIFVLSLATFGSAQADLDGDGTVTISEPPLYNDGLIGFRVTDNSVNPTVPVAGLTVSVVPGDGSPPIQLTYNATVQQYQTATPLPYGAFQLVVSGVTPGHTIGTIRIAAQNTINGNEALASVFVNAPAGSSVTVTGTGLDGNPLTLAVAPTLPLGYAITAAQIAQFQDGALALQAVQTDLAGNSTTVNSVVQLDRQAPGAPVLSVDAAIADGISQAEILAGFPLEVSLAGTGAKVGDMIEILIGGSVEDRHVVTQADLDAGSYSHQLQAAPEDLAGIDGDYAFSARIVDAAGNLGATSGTLVLSVDASVAAPVIAGLENDTGSSSSDLLTNDASLVLTGVEPGASVEYSFDNGQSWSTDYTPAQGANTVLVRQTDAVGNISAPSAPFSFTYDTVAPTGVFVVPLATFGATQEAAADGTVTIVEPPLYGDLLAGFRITDITVNSGVVLSDLTVSVVPGDGSPAIPLTYNATFSRYEAATPVPEGSFQLVVSGVTAGHTIGTTRIAFQTTINSTEAHANVPISAPAGSVVTVTGTGLDGNPLTVTAAFAPFGGLLTPAQIAQFQNGPLTFQAVQTDTAGNSTSASYVVQLDRQAPNMPTAMHMAEGTIISAIDAADGTQILGTTDAGTTVTFTLNNGSNTLVKDAVVTGTDFALNLTADEIAALGEGFVTYSAIARDAGGNASGVVLTGRYFYTTQPLADSDSRIDVAPAPGVLSEDAPVGVSSLSGGGFAVDWAVDTDGNGDEDSYAFQRFDAAGDKVGGPVTLSGIGGFSVGNGQPIVDNELVSSTSLMALDGGGYALVFSIEHQEVFTALTLTASAEGQFVTPLTGVPESFQVQNFTLASNGLPPKVFLSGTGNDGLPLNLVEVPLVNGEYRVTQALLDMFLIDNRFQVTVNNLAPNSTATLTRLAAEDVIYDSDAPLVPEALSRVIPAVNPGAGVAFLNAARAEYFHIDSRVDSLGNPITTALPNGVLQIIPSMTGSISISGISGASILANGVIQIGGIVPDADGNYFVPQSILDQLGTHDASINLILTAQPFGSIVNATAYKTASYSAPEGVFVQTFDANGVATGVAVQVDLGGSPPQLGDENLVDVSPLSDGGFAVRWVVDTDDDGDGDTMAVQHFDAAGVKVGGIVELQGIDPVVIAETERIQSYDLVGLDGGGYAMTYTLNREVTTKPLVLTSSLSSVGLGGIPATIFLNSAPAGTTITLSGKGSDGNPHTEVLTFTNGFLHVTQALLDNFAYDARLFLAVQGGLAQGQAATLTVELEDGSRYDPAVSTTPTAVSGVVNVINSFFSLGAIGTEVGRIEAFHLDQQATFNTGLPPEFKLFQILVSVPFNANALNLSGIVGQGGVSAIFVNQESGQLVIQFTDLAQTDFAIPQQILDQIGTGDFQAALIALGLNGAQTFDGTLDVRAGTEVPEGVFVQTFDDTGSSLGAPERLDALGSLALLEESTPAAVTSVPGGGFVVRYVVDVNDDGDGDTLALQRYDSAGAKLGDLVLLQGLQHIDNILSYDLTSLDNGGFALSLEYEREHYIRQVTFVGGGPTDRIGFAGAPVALTLLSQPAGATLGFNLLGTDANGDPVTIALTLVNGRIDVTQEMLDQLAQPNRAFIQITGLAAGQSASVMAEIVGVVGYDDGSATQDISVVGTISPNAAGNPDWNVGVLSTSDGRVEAFHLDASPLFNSVANAPKLFQMYISVPFDPATINLSAIIGQGGVTGASVSPQGQLVLNFGNTAQTDFNVPQVILDMVGEGDLAAALVAIGLDPSVTVFDGTVVSREGATIPEGVFVQTFDPEGIALSNDLTIQGNGLGNLLFGDAGDDTLIGNSLINVMAGGDGDDNFVFTNSSPIYNMVLDFQTGSDVIDLSGLDAVTGTPEQDAFHFIGADTFTGTAGELRYEVVQDGINLTMDRDGDGIADYTILLSGLSTIAPEDIVL